MAIFTTEQKRDLSSLLAKGHRTFGKVAPRKPFYEDEGGEGGSELRFREHPLLGQQPVGASSDLTSIVSEQKNIREVTEERAADCCNELQAQPIIQQALQHGSISTPRAY